MTPTTGRRFLRTTALTSGATGFGLLALVVTVAFLAWRYSSLPDILPVRFRWDGQPNGWQFRTVPRVLMPVFVQAGLLVTFLAVSALLRFRRDADVAVDADDARAARAASEAIMLMAAIWVGFQAYAAVALVQLWSGAASTLGVGYTALQVLCGGLTIVVGLRARGQLGHPQPLPYVATHWRLRELYCNPDHAALFVPTRAGGRWTLNFGRPAAAFLLGGVLLVGIVAPSLMFALALR